MKISCHFRDAVTIQQTISCFNRRRDQLAPRHMKRHTPQFDELADTSPDRSSMRPCSIFGYPTFSIPEQDEQEYSAEEVQLTTDDLARIARMVRANFPATSRAELNILNLQSTASNITPRFPVGPPPSKYVRHRAGKP